jgi:hypothetical protein
VHQYGLDVVVDGVSHCHPIRAGSVRYLSQEVIADFAGGFFRGKTVLGLICSDITPFYGGRDIQLAGQVSDIPGIGFGLGTA